MFQPSLTCIAPRKTSNNSFASERFVFGGRPSLKVLKSLYAAASLILEADIPSIPLASGSLSPDETTSILSKAYN